MARNETVTLTAATWTELTTSDATKISVQSLDRNPILLQGTSGSAPTSESGSFRIGQFDWVVNVALTDLFPGVSGAVRVWAKSGTSGARLVVSHG